MTPARSHWRGALALVCAAQLVASSPASARNQEVAAPVGAAERPAEATSGPEAARRYFREGKRLYGERRYAEAAEAFTRSLAAAWSIQAIYNRALALDRADELVAALRAYRDYLERADAADKDRATALERSEKLRLRVGEVLLQVDSPEAIREIRINGEPVAKDAFPWLTLPGPLDVEFVGELPGQRKAIRADVRPGGTVTIVFPGFLRPVVRPVEVTPRTPDPLEPRAERRQGSLRAAFWTTTALTLAGGVTVAVLGSRVLLYRQREAAVCDPTCDEFEALEKDRLRDRFEDFKTATNVTVVVSAALGVAALALGIALKRERSRMPTSTGARLRWLGPAVELTF